MRAAAAGALRGRQRRCYGCGGVSFADGGTVFASKTTAELAVAAALFRCAVSPALMGAARKAVAAVTAPNAGLLAMPMRGAMRATVFRHFCAGETFEDCKVLADKLAPAKVRLIVDHSVEEKEDPGSWEVNLRNKIALLQRCKESLGDRVSFVPVKVTALASPGMLERLTEALAAQAGWCERPLIGAEGQPDPPLPDLGAEAAELLRRSEENLGELCAAARETGVPVLLDAEQTHRQPGIDLLALRLMRRFNSRGTPPIVYNTYQMYLRDATPRLRRDMAAAAAGRFAFAAKVVRGAYVATEVSRAKQLQRQSPVHDSKAETDRHYDAAIAAMIASIGQDPEGAALIVATHNARSAALACEAMEKAGLPRDHPNVAFAQILGMCDNITLALGQAGYRSHKLVLYGAFDDILPWMMRRLDENGDSLSAMGAERLMLWREVRRRLRLGS